jgi:YidC/Oxa1 family membrane protein insertase
MEKRTLVAFVLSFIVLFGWIMIFAPEKEQIPESKSVDEKVHPVKTPKDQGVQEPVPTAPAGVAEKAEKIVIPDAHVKEIRIDTPLYSAVLTNEGPTIKSFRLKKYRKTIDPESDSIEIVTLKEGMGEFLLMGFEGSSTGKGSRVFQVDRDRLSLSPDSPPRQIVFQCETPEGLLIRQTFRFHPDMYRIDSEIEAFNRSSVPLNGAFCVRLKAIPPDKKSSYYSFTGLALLQNNSLEELEIEKGDDEKDLSGRIDWIAYEDDFFISAVIPDQAVKGNFKARVLPSGVLEGIFNPPPVSIAPSDQASAQYTVYVGPRDLGVLKQLGKNLDRAVNFGWTDIIAKPLLYLLRFFNQYIGNYGVSIILLTILIKILFWPLTHKSYKSMKEMQKLQPRMAKLREKYKNDKQKLNQEMMALYKTYKVNPMGGCLPMVIQIPVFFALFRILGNSIELRHAPFMLWINDLSAPDRLFHFPFSIPFMTPPYGIPVLTLLMGASMFLQQKMTPTPGDPMQAKIMMFMPIIFTFLFINFPSGLVLYWFVNNILSIGQQYRIYKKA